MGAGGSVSAGSNEALEFVRGTVAMDMSGSDVNTPRGETAKAEVLRLRKMLADTQEKTVQALAKARFSELDLDKSGFLENNELLAVADWVMVHFGASMGEDKDKVVKKIMRRLDTNKDGKLDIEEFGKLFGLIVQRHDLVLRATLKFNELDKDGSGSLESDEIDATVMWTLQAFPNDDDLNTYKKHLLSHIDANGDGKIDLNEFIILFEDLLVRLELIERARVKFNELDTDKSGVLEAAEIDKVVDWVLAAYGERPADQLAGFKATLMKRIDVNKDGKLSLQEFAVLFDEIMMRMDLISQARKAFSKLDENGNGFLEKEEVAKVLTFWATRCGEKVGIDPSQPLDALMAKVDVNGDGKLSLAEFIPLFEDVTIECGMWTLGA